jgi:hypothetical protein
LKAALLSVALLAHAAHAAAPIEYVGVGKLRVTMEKTLFADVARIAGPAPIESDGGDGGRLFSLCYVTGDQRVWFVSDGETGGPRRAVTGLIVETVAAIAPTANCPAFAKASLPLSINGWLWLGTPLAEVDRRLGPPVGEAGEWRLHGRLEKVEGTAKDCPPSGLNRSTEFSVAPKDGRVVGISLRQTTTC